MTILSQQAHSDAISAAIQAGGNQPQDPSGLEEALITLRSRIRSSGRLGTLGQQKAALSRALAPLVLWISREPSLSRLEPLTRSDLLWNLFTAGVSRTQSADAFPLVTNDELQWNELVSNLAAPTEELAEQPDNKTGSWHLQVLVLGLLFMALDPWLPSDRLRLYGTALGTFLLGCAIILWTFGWTRSPWELRALRAQATRPRPRPHDTTYDDLPFLETLGGETLSDAPPPGVPPVPTLEQQLGFSSAKPLDLKADSGIGVGQTVTIVAIPPYTSLVGQKGTVTFKAGDLFSIQALTVTTQGNETSDIQHNAAANLTYAPFSGLGSTSTKLQLQAGRLKDAVTKASALAATTPQWGGLFWQAVKNEKELYSLEPEIGNILQSHGYVGDGTVGPPRAEELRKNLQEVETLGGVTHGTGGTFARVADINLGENPEQMAWHLKLPADLQRAAPELYRNIRVEGVASVRQWVNDQRATLEQKQTPTYQDLFSAATIIDFELADCKSEPAIMHKLGTSDSLEIQLRKLGAFIYYRRTKDKFGANRMLGIRAPGSQTDIAPKWLLDEANLHSKIEWQRTERGQKMTRQEHGSHSSAHTGEGGPKTRYAGKFRGRGSGSKGGG